MNMFIKNAISITSFVLIFLAAVFIATSGTALAEEISIGVDATRSGTIDSIVNAPVVFNDLTESGGTAIDLNLDLIGSACEPTCNSGTYGAQVVGTQNIGLDSGATGNLADEQITIEGLGTAQHMIDLTVGTDTFSAGGQIGFFGQVATVFTGGTGTSDLTHNAGGTISNGMTYSSGLCGTVACDNADIQTAFTAWDRGTSSTSVISTESGGMLSLDSLQNSQSAIQFTVTGPVVVP